MSSAVQDLLSILDLEPLEVNLFRGRSPQVGWQRVFGGQVIGQALVAATRTVEGRPPHSLHAYFLLAGDPKVPIIYEVDRIRDGKSFTTRRVVAIQHGQRDLLHVGVVSRRRGRARPPGQDAERAEARRAAERCRDQGEDPAADARAGAQATTSASGRSNCGRWISAAISDRNRTTADFNVWIRTTGRLPDDPAIHRCVLAYASDMMLLDTALLPHRRSVFDRNIMAASLDHALWFHRPFRADEWLLYAQDSPNLHGARGFARGLIFSADGTLVASVAQEGLLRERRPQARAWSQAALTAQAIACGNINKTAYVLIGMPIS